MKNCLICETPFDGEYGGLFECKVCQHVCLSVFEETNYSVMKGRATGSHHKFKILERAADIDNLIKDHKISHPRLLDIGCGSGDFIREICTKFETIESRVSGVEVSLDRLVAQQYAEVYSSLSSVNGLFNIVTCYHVLEHIENPYEFIFDLKSVLDQEAVVVIEVPNRFGNRFNERDLNKEHLHFFSPQSLSLLLGRCGFNLRTLATGKFETNWYHDCIRVVASYAFGQQNTLSHTIANTVGQQFCIAGVGGDYIEYLEGKIPHDWVLGYYDTNKKVHPVYDSVEVFPLKEINLAVPVLITSLQYAKDIESVLVANGVSRDRIYHLHKIYYNN